MERVFDGKDGIGLDKVGIIIRKFIVSRLFFYIAIASLLTWVTASWRDSRRLFASTLSSITDAVLATDREGRITFLNPVAEALTGWPRNEARGKPADEVVSLI